MTLSGKTIFSIATLYGVIVAAGNVIGVVIPNIFTSNDLTNGEIDGWLNFLHNSPTSNTIPGFCRTINSLHTLCFFTKRKEIQPFHKPSDCLFDHRDIRLDFLFHTGTVLHQICNQSGICF